MPRYILFVICFFVLQLLNAQEPASFINIETQPKQTFYSVARDFSVDIKLLKKYNEQYAPDFLLKIGDVVRVPVFETKSSPKAEIKSTSTTQNKTHKVEKGETAYGLCKKYSISIQDLKQWNNMSSDLGLKLGQTLIVGKIKIEKPIPTTPISTVNVSKENKTVTKPVQTIKEEIKEEALFTPPTKTNEVKQEVIEETKVQIQTPTTPKPTIEITKPQSSIIGKSISIMRGIGKTSIESALSSAAFAYYDYAKVGDNIKVVNLMSKKVYYMKVIGKIPASEKDDETIIVVSPETLQHLGTNENRFLVQVSIQ